LDVTKAAMWIAGLAFALFLVVVAYFLWDVYRTTLP
jgi:hypothetical protein